MIDMNENSAPSFVAFSVIFIVLSSFTVSLRLLSRRISAANFWWEYVFSESRLLIQTHVAEVFTLETYSAGLPQTGNTDGEIVIQRCFHCDQPGRSPEGTVYSRLIKYYQVLSFGSYAIVFIGKTHFST